MLMANTWIICTFNLVVGLTSWGTLVSWVHDCQTTGIWHINYFESMPYRLDESGGDTILLLVLLRIVG
jgi:hypothetical protein